LENGQIQACPPDWPGPDFLPVTNKVAMPAATENRMTEGKFVIGGKEPGRLGIAISL
jgi:hypothetical protein